MIGPKTTLLAEGVVGSPRVSGDGRTVVWNQIVDGNLEIMRWHDGVVDQVTRDGRADMHPSVSYDGKVIAWTRFSSFDPSDRQGTWDIYQWRDGVESAVATGSGNQLSPAVSGDGRVIAWEDDETGHWSNFNIYKWEDGRTEAITSGPGDRSAPFMSFDGGRIFWRDASGSSSDIWLKDQAGVVKPVVTTDSDQITPSTNADGTMLLWADNENGDDDLKLWAENGIHTVAGERQVDETWGRLSGNGQTVVWTSFDRRKGDPADCQVYLQDRGAPPIQATWGQDGLSSFPDVSHDGKVVVWMWVDKDDTRHCKIFLHERP